MNQMRLLAQIGNNLIIKELILDSSFGGMCLKTLPIHLQKKYYNEKIPVMLPKFDVNGNFVSGPKDHFMKNYCDLVRDECRQLFERGIGVRSLEQQRIYLMRENHLLPSQTKIEYKTVIEQACKFSFNRVQIEPSIFTQNQVKEIWIKMKNMKKEKREKVLIKK